jgi:hypothetical protein
MFFRADAGVFDPHALHDLKACADHLLARTSGNRTSIGHHMADVGSRPLIKAAVTRFFSSPLPKIFAERFGQQPALNLIFTTIRRQDPEIPEARVGWHIDLNFIADTVPFLVAWTPLEDVGETRIGLDICVPAKLPSLASILAPWQSRSEKGQGMVFHDSEVDSIFGTDGYQVRPLRLPAGGAAVFDQFVFHRTQNLAHATDSRRSFEFRMVDLNALPASWSKQTTFFCRRSSDAVDGIEFLFKRGEGAPQPIADRRSPTRHASHQRQLMIGLKTLHLTEFSDQGCPRSLRNTPAQTVVNGAWTSHSS